MKIALYIYNKHQELSKIIFLSSISADKDSTRPLVIMSEI